MANATPLTAHSWLDWMRLLALKMGPLGLGIAILSTCAKQRDPQIAYDHARESLSHGDIEKGASEAKKGYKQFHNMSAEWAWKFALLEARALHRRHLDHEVLERLASEPTTPPAGELAIQKQRWEGLAYASLHRFDEAERLFSEAERMCSISENVACADVADAQGDMEMERGRYGEAQVFFEKVLTSARASGDGFWEAKTLLDLSWSADEQTHFDEALERANAARRIAVSKNFSDIAQKALGNMGWAYYKLGDPEKADAMFKEAKSQAEKLGEVASEVGWLTDSGYANLDIGNIAVAQEAFQQSLELARKIDSREDIINSLIALAFVSEQTLHVDEAKHYADEALARVKEENDTRDQVFLQLVQGRVAARLHNAATAKSAFREVAQAPDCPVFLKWEAERSLARLYEDEKKFDSARNEYRTALTTFEGARSELKHEDSRLPFLNNASRIYDDYIHLLVTQGRAAEALQAADFSRARTLSEGLGLLRQGTSLEPLLSGQVNARQVASHAGGTILFYWLGEEQSYLWAITPRDVRLFQLPPSAEIKTRVERYRKAIVEQRETSPTAIDDGTALFRILVEPAKSLLPANGKVFIVPDGSLNSLNFETLLVSNPEPATKEAKKEEATGHYWIEDVTISSASSLRMLQAFPAAHGGGAGELLLFGDAIAPSEDFPQLPKASIEMESIKKHFPPNQQQVFSREEANPPAYLASKPERFSYIHFVAHGTASRLSPLDSAVVLSKTNAPVSGRANAEEDSFKLYARDIVAHPLHAELVTVSTCRSAGERAYSGEGLVGLSWAFVRAGAHNVIAALWDVSDASTPQLMDELYGELKKGKAPDAALRDAKLTLLRSSSNPAFRKPFYWAPFQLYTGS
ncbi:MAG: CHAT domain-containing protein [Terriglobales bacterium]